ncbi:FtsX-like permease family protein [bacterium]|nr:FtsX-like permease family protein [bacterium]
MISILKIAIRNLYRQKRRTYLTMSIVAFGVLAVLLFTAVAGSFKNMMIGQITDSMLGHLQIHRKGYVSSLDSLPLNKMITQKQIKKLQSVLDEIPEIEAYSFRILMGGMLSNYVETTNIRIAAIDPEQETKVTLLMKDRLMKGNFLKQGEILIPELIAKGFGAKVDSDIVIIANNAEGSVNGQSLKISGIMESVIGPTGKFGYISIEDAMSILRMEEIEINEIAIRLKRIDDLENVVAILDSKLGEFRNKEGKPVFEVHPWDKLSPFSNIANMIDLLALFIKIILVGIVLISIMNVMVMAVYERVKEIGTMAAIGTLPWKIRMIFVCEGLFLGIFGALVGSILSVAAIFAVRYLDLTISFGRSDNIPLNPDISITQILLTAVVVIVVSVVAVLEPAYKASKLEPIEALRQG